MEAQHRKGNSMIGLYYIYEDTATCHACLPACCACLLCLPFCLFACLFTCLSVCLAACLSVLCLFLCLSLHLFLCQFCGGNSSKGTNGIQQTSAYLPGEVIGHRNFVAIVNWQSEVCLTQFVSRLPDQQMYPSMQFSTAHIVLGKIHAGLKILDK
jgi:hypothetical protein